MNKQNEICEITEGNICADLGLDHPEELLAKAEFLLQLNDLIKSSKLSQKEMAQKLGITQVRFSLLLKRKLFSLTTKTVLRYLKKLGYKVEMIAEKPKSKTQEKIA